GRSDLPPVPYAHRIDVAALLATLQIQSAVILGASYGGKIATQIALEFPGLVRGLILINSQIGSTEVSVELQSGWDRVEAAERAGDIDLAVEIELQMWVDGPHRSAADVDPAVRDQVRRMNGALFARQGEQEQAPEIVFDPPVAERLAELCIPILAISGDLDFDDIRMSVESLVQVLPATIVRPVKGAAHLPNLEQPDKINELILEFLNSIQN
ncbi:MAG: alpha/beta fold hydrolase, partial [Thermomicrobiales bacterium]